MHADRLRLQVLERVLDAGAHQSCDDDFASGNFSWNVKGHLQPSFAFREQGLTFDPSVFPIFQCDE